MQRHARILGLLCFLFVAPGVIAYWVYLHPQWLQARTNHGHLLEPPPFLHEELAQEKWQILYWTPHTASSKDMQRLDDLAKLRLALGRRLYYVDLVLASKTSLAEVGYAVQNHLAKVDGHWLHMTDAESEVLGNHSAIYLVNPQHYVILAYSVETPLQDIFDDLQKMVHDK